MARSRGWTARVAASRKQIGEQALALFLARGFDEVTIAEIATAAGVGERTVYRHFPTKESFVFGSAPDSFDRLIAEIAKAPPEIPVTDAVIRALSSSSENRHSDIEAERARMTLLRRHPMLQHAWVVELQHLEAGLSRWLVTRYSRPEDDIACRMIAATIVAAHRIATQRWDGISMTSYLEDLTTAITVSGETINSLGTAPQFG